MGTDTEARRVSPLAVGSAVEAGVVLGQAFVDDPLMRYYFEGDEDRSEPVAHNDDAGHLVSLDIEPASQHRGHGSWLLERVLQWLPSASAVCLETANERNLPLYLRHGFEITSEFVAHNGKGPKTWAPSGHLSPSRRAGRR